MPPNRHLIDSKWLFQKKRDGQFRTCLVSRGYTQLPGVDFTNNYSPVVTDITLRVILLMWVIKKGISETIDTETVFSYAFL